MKNNEQLYNSSCNNQFDISTSLQKTQQRQDV